MRLRFLGGAGTVTGSKTLVETDAASVLVDCGLFQGFKHLRLKNRAPPPFRPETLAAILLTHAHLDHSGWLPVVVRAGFRGPIWCTSGTRDLVAILLRDAAKLEQEQAEWLRKKKKSKHELPTPLFTVDDADAAIERLVAVPDGDITVAPGLTARFTPVGHIIGAASIHLASAGASVVFSGDVGRPHDTLLRAPMIPPAAHTLVLESTYGARRHPRQSPRLVLADILRRTLERGGIVMVPAFAVGRAQAVLHLVGELMDDGEVPRVPVFLNSPMASAVTDATLAHAHELAIDTTACRALGALAERIDTTERSKALNERRGPMIVVAGSGMMTGGRILHHLAAWGSNRKNLLLLTGFQAPGTRGAALLDGAETLRLFGEDVAMRCEVERFDMLSGHADGDELVAWVRSFPWRPRQVLLNHGDPAASDALRLRLERELNLSTRVVLEHDELALPAKTPTKESR